MKILITGGLGNLGSWLTYNLLDEHFVTVLARKEREKIEHPNYNFVQADITDIEQLNLAIYCYYDVCIHTASYNEHFQDDYTKNALLINSLGTEFLCQSLARHGVGQFVYLSTFHVYGKLHGVVNESKSVEPVNDYGLTHYFAEKYVEKHHRLTGLRYVILRLSNSYGCPTFINSDKWYLALNDLCWQSKENKKIQLNSNGLATRDFIWMGDVVEIIRKLIDLPQPLNSVFNLSSGMSYSLNQIANKVKTAYEKEFSESIMININESDKSELVELIVSNDKLSNIVRHDYSDKIEHEAQKIFQLLAE